MEIEADFPGHGHAVLDFSLSPLRVDGKIEGVVGVSRDISERKEKTRRLETLISNLPGIVYRCWNTPGWPMELVRGECEDITGYSAADLEDGTVVWGEDIIHPEDHDEMWETVQTSLESNQMFEVTYRIKTQSGKTKWMWERGRVVTTHSSDEELLEGFITDISERKQREKRLQQLKEEYQELFNGMNDTAWVIDTDGNIVAVNDAAVNSLGYSRDELLSMQPQDIDEGLEDVEVTSLIESMPEEEKQVFETVHRRKDGKEIPVEISSSLITYRGETAILSIARELSDEDSSVSD